MALAVPRRRGAVFNRSTVQPVQPVQPLNSLNPPNPPSPPNPLSR